MPTKGLFIEFEENADEACSMSVTQAPPTQNATPNGSDTNDTSNQNDTVCAISPVKSSENIEDNTQSTKPYKPVSITDVMKKQKPMSEISLEDIDHIPLMPDYTELLSAYFSESIYVVQNTKTENTNKLLNYQLMKRFITTAFDHLIDKDASFMDDKLCDLKVLLERTYRVFKNLEELAQYPEAKYEALFLKNQRAYNKVCFEVENNKRRISQLSELVSSLEKNMKNAEKTFLGLSVKSPNYSSLNSKIKKMRTKYVDSLEELKELESKNKFYENLKRDFVKKYKEEFIEYFKKQADMLTAQIMLILNSNAYEFDNYLWILAKKSQGIKRFFIDANIDGSFSSKTFLKYFLKTLDGAKMSEEYIQMQELLEYLDTLEKGSILIVDDRSEMLPALRYFANHVDKKYKVKLLRPIDVLKELSKNHVDYIITNVHIRGIKLFDLIQQVKAVRKNLEFILTSDQFTKDVLIKAKNHNLKHFIATNVEDKVLLETLEKIVIKD
jgi:hypothetical protein